MAGCRKPLRRAIFFILEERGLAKRPAPADGAAGRPAGGSAGKPFEYRGGTIRIGPGTQNATKIPLDEIDTSWSYTGGSIGSWKLGSGGAAAARIEHDLDAANGAPQNCLAGYPHGIGRDLEIGVHGPSMADRHRREDIRMP